MCQRLNGRILMVMQELDLLRLTYSGLMDSLLVSITGYCSLHCSDDCLDILLRDPWLSFNCAFLVVHHFSDASQIVSERTSLLLIFAMLLVIFVNGTFCI